WQKPWVQNLLPLLTSLAVHATILIIAVYLISKIPEIMRPQYQEQIIIPDATIVEGAVAGGIPNPGLGDDPMRRATQDKLGNVGTIVFICDASGSMMNKRLALNSELKKAIDKLKAIQGFNVIFFSKESKADAFSSGQLVMATPDNKSKAYSYIDNTSFAGTSYVIPGLEIAFRQRPQLIYLLTDGDFENETNDVVLRKVRDLEKGAPIKINTI